MHVADFIKEYWNVIAWAAPVVGTLGLIVYRKAASFDKKLDILTNISHSQTKQISDVQTDVSDVQAQVHGVSRRVTSIRSAIMVALPELKGVLENGHDRYES
jgi:hypothetical protein